MLKAEIRLLKEHPKKPNIQPSRLEKSKKKFRKTGHRKTEGI